MYVAVIAIVTDAMAAAAIAAESDAVVIGAALAVWTLLM